MAKTIVSIDENLYAYMLRNWVREPGELEMSAMQISAGIG